MAYDPKDPEDKKIVQGLIDAALAEAQETFETETKGLKDKNKELLGKLKEASTGKNDPAEIAALEAKIEEGQTALAKVTKDFTKAQKLADERGTELETEKGFAQRLLVEGGLTEALATNKVAPAFLPAVKSLLMPKAQVKIDGTERIVVIGDKPLGEFVKEWSQSDEGKHFVSAPTNGSGNGPGNKVNGKETGKTMTRAAYDAAVAAGTFNSSFFTEGGQLTDNP